jgi:hypothetical protein
VNEDQVERIAVALERIADSLAKISGSLEVEVVNSDGTHRYVGIADSLAEDLATISDTIARNCT